MSARSLPAHREELEELWQDIASVDVTPALATRAGDLAEEHRLRGYDAVHLASALEVGTSDTVLVTDDDRLIKAAQSAGLMTARVSSQSSVG